MAHTPTWLAKGELHSCGGDGGGAAGSVMVELARPSNVIVQVKRDGIEDEKVCVESIHENFDFQRSVNRSNPDGHLPPKGC